MAITPYYLSLIDIDNPHDPIRAQAIPRLAELHIDASELEDPLAEEVNSPVQAITHRYPDRVMFYTTHNCPVYCRHCFRKRKVSDPTSASNKAQLQIGIDYIKDNINVRDVLLSGGDPLTFSDDRLEYLISSLHNIPHVDFIRLATRNPVTLPQRITAELCRRLKRYPPIYLNTHFNHLQECTPEAALALDMLADAGVVLGNQMVLLKGVNEDPAMVQEMNRWLLRHRCRPYYIFQCDAAFGISHFRTPVESGLKIIDNIRGWTSGMAVPHYVIDLPGGGGKVPMIPDYFKGNSGEELIFKSYNGKEYSYKPGAKKSPLNLK